MIDFSSPQSILDNFEELLIYEDSSSVIRNHVDEISTVLPELKITVGFEQHSIYHNLDVFEHTMKVLDGIPVGLDGKRDVKLAYAALLHDIGKPEVFVLDEEGHGHMKKHQRAGERIASVFLPKTNLNKDDIYYIRKLVLLHDVFPEANVNSVTQFVREVGRDFIKDLFILQNADILAHSEIGKKRMLKLDAIKELAICHL